MTETVNRKLPFWLKTCGRISRKNILFRKICNRLPFNPSKKVRGNNYSDVVGVGNYPMELQLDDHIDATIWWHGNYEPVESGLFSKVVKPGDTVLDLGANIGYYTLLAASRVGAGGRIFRFEPVSTTFARLKKNLCGIEFVEATQAACGDAEGDVEMFVGAASGSSRILKPLLPAESLRKEKAPLITVDGFLRAREINKVDVVKIDVEGYEFKAIEGMKETIKSNPNIKIFMEFNEKFLKMAGTTPEDFIEYMKELGLRLWRVTLSASNKYVCITYEKYWGKEASVIFSKDDPLG